MQKIFKHLNPNNKTKILDYTYTSQPQINNALPLQKSNIRLALFIIGCIVSLGFLWLVTKWSSRKKAILMYSVCQDLQATHFLIEQQGNKAQIVQRTDKLDIKHRLQTPAFVYHERTYLYYPQKQCFLPVRYQQLGLHLDQIKNDQYQPYAQNQRQKIRQYYGTNIINLLVKTKLQVFLQEMLTPYQVFQTYAILLWICQQYYLFSFLLMGYSIYTYWCNSTQITTNQEKLQKQSYFDIECKILIGQYVPFSQSKIMAPSKIKQRITKQLSQIKQNNRQEKYVIDQDLQVQPKVAESTSKQKMKNLTIKNDNWNFQKFSSQMILPGDIIILKQGDTVPCDCILLNKQILVNQSYTTGQSYLVRKTLIKNFVYTIDASSSFTLFLGTKIVKIKSEKYQKNNYQNKFNQQFYLNKKLVTLQPNQIICFVTDTNYNTQRGKFLRAIRHQKRNQQTFTRQTIYFIYILFGITLISFLTILYRINEKGNAFDHFITFLDLLTLSIPPTLPTALSVGINFAQIRLRKKHIHCVLPQNILTGGRTDVIVLQGNRAFGKQVEVQSVVAGVKNQRGFGSIYFSLDQFKEDQYQNKIARMFFRALASCHTLQIYEDKIQGQRQESELMKFCGGQFAGQDLFKIGSSQISVKRRIYFKHKDKKLAVLVDIKDNDKKGQLSLIDCYDETMKQQDQQYDKDQFKKKVVFIKGPPEKIISICKAKTYPADSYAYFVDMAEKGFLIIAYAFKYTQYNISQQQMHQTTKQEFTFLGFAILKRKRHPDVQASIDTIKNANLKLICISQDRQLQANSLAILNHVSTKNQLLSCTINKAKDQIFCRGHIQWQSNVGQNCISEFGTQVQDFGKNSKLSLSSTLYEQIFMRKQEQLYDKIFDQSVIFNKMEHKHQRNIYYQLEKRNLVSFAVGGGGTLSECANLSMQLQRSQSSLLSSFHTQNNSLQTVINCLKICRAGLSTNFHCFNMMILFSITQFTTVVMLEYNYQTISDNQMLYEDLFITFPIFITMNMTRPTDKLSKQRPICSFFSLRALLSMGGLMIFQLLAQITFFIYLSFFSQFTYQKQSSYAEYLKSGQFKETTVTAISTFILTNYLYLGAILATSVSKSFRKPFYTNPFYTANIFVLWIYNNIIVLFPALAPGLVVIEKMNQQAYFALLMALIYGNLIMLLMYLYEVVLDSIWAKCHKSASLIIQKQFKRESGDIKMVQQGQA